MNPQSVRRPLETSHQSWNKFPRGPGDADSTVDRRNRTRAGLVAISDDVRRRKDSDLAGQFAFRVLTRTHAGFYLPPLNRPVERKISRDLMFPQDGVGSGLARTLSKPGNLYRFAPWCFGPKVRETISGRLFALFNSSASSSKSRVDRASLSSRETTTTSPVRSWSSIRANSGRARFAPDTFSS